LRFLREPNHSLPKVPLEAASKVPERNQRLAKPLRPLCNIAGFSTVFMPGASPSFIFRASHSLPHVMALRTGYVRGLCDFSASGCEKGFIYVDNYVSCAFQIISMSLTRVIPRMLFEHVNYHQGLCLITRGHCAGYRWESRLII
jgi:hypothetical protein